MRVIEVLEQGISDGTHIGAQVYVSREGEVVADCALGDARSSVPMTTGTLMNWFSMTKAVTAVAVAQQWEAGALDIDAAAARYVPEFGANGKYEITLRHLLTHTAGIPNADGMLQGQAWRESRAENLARIYAAAPEYPPGTRAGYHAAAGMTVLGEVVARVSGMPYERYVRERIFEPVGAHDCWVGLPEERYEAYGDRIGFMHATSGDSAQPVPRINSARSAATSMPGAGGRGPMNQLGRVYEALLRGGAPLVSPVTLAAISARHRTEMFDETFGIVVDWGLGLAVDTSAMGRHCSRRTFGHGGHLSSVAFCDPEHGVVVAVVCNGMPDRDRHYRRLDAISSAVYVDLGLAGPDEQGRAKPFPTAGL
jgi:CubicO group peptidase (beta-lactamase class C family)